MPPLLGWLRLLWKGMVLSQQLENLFRGHRPSVGLVWARWWLLGGVRVRCLLLRGIRVRLARLARLTGFGLIVRAVIVLVVVIFIVVAVGSGCLRVTWHGPRTQQFPVERARRHGIGSHRRRIALVHICRHRGRGTPCRR